MKEFDVAVVGNGAIALSIAYWLHDRSSDCRAAIIGPARGQGCASRAAGAMLGNFGEVGAHAGVSPAHAAKLRLGCEASALWPEFVEALRVHAEQATAPRLAYGTFIILSARASAVEERNYQAIVAALAARGEPHEEVEPRTIPGLNPDDACRPQRALYVPREGYVDTSQVLDALDRMLAATVGHSRVEDQAVAIQVSDSGSHTVLLATGGEVTARHVVIAAGAYSQALIDSIDGLAARVPRLVSGVGTSVVLETTVQSDAVVRTPNRMLGCGLHAIPRQGGRMYLGATNRAELLPAERPPAEDMLALLTEGARAINRSFAGARVIQTHVGNRPLTLDSFPIIGPTHIEGVYIATGTYRSGFQMSPLIGKRIAQALQWGRDEACEPLFWPERRPISTCTREQAIEATIEHLLAKAYERDVLDRTMTRWDAWLEAPTRALVASVYRELDEEFTPPPELFPILARGRRTWQTLSVGPS